jgi:hypothetical protein
MAAPAAIGVVRLIESRNSYSFTTEPDLLSRNASDVPVRLDACNAGTAQPLITGSWARS